MPKRPLTERINSMVMEALQPSGDGPEFRTAYDQLRMSERLFVDHYIQTSDPRGAALRAYPALRNKPSAADPRALEMYRRPLVQAAIAEKLKAISDRAFMSAEEVISEIAKIAKANLADYVKIDSHGEPYIDLSEVTREQMAAVSEVTVEDYTEGRGEDAREIKRVKFKQHDKLNALEKLMKYYGLQAPTQVELSGRNGAPIQTENRNINVNMSVGEAADLYAATLVGDE